MRKLSLIAVILIQNSFDADRAAAHTYFSASVSIDRVFMPIHFIERNNVNILRFVNIKQREKEIDLYVLILTGFIHHTSNKCPESYRQAVFVN